MAHRDSTSLERRALHCVVSELSLQQCSCTEVQGHCHIRDAVKVAQKSRFRHLATEVVCKVFILCRLVGVSASHLRRDRLLTP
jgi:hypothetical protein